MDNRKMKIDLRMPDHAHQAGAFRRPPGHSEKRRRIKKIAWAIGVILTLFVVGVVGDALVTKQSLGDTINRLPLIGDLGRLIGARDKALKGAREGRTNILLLGVGGSGHEGPDLADTIMVSSIRHETKEVAVISLPRDFVAEIPGHGMRKINEANAYGEAKKRGMGPEMAARVVERVLNIPLHYYIRVDFKAFEEIIDAIGGIDVYVTRGFVDPTYPLGPNQYQTVSFSAGQNHFDGATTLKYARSRYTTSDYDRAQRQQEILKAMKEKAFSLTTWLDPSAVIALWRSLDKNISSNISKNELQIFLGLIPKLNTDTMRQLVLSTENYLMQGMSSDGAFVLLPKTQGYRDIQAAALNIFSDVPDTVARASISQGIIVIHNGTPISGLAQKHADILSKNGFNVIAIGNAAAQTYTKTVIYDLTRGRHPRALAFLKATLDASVALTIPEEVTRAFDENVDYYIIIGQSNS